MQVVESGTMAFVGASVGLEDGARVGFLVGALEKFLKQEREKNGG